MAFIEIKNLTKKYGDKSAVDNISFEVIEGEVFGFLGPNGAGKTTTINILCTLLQPTSGVASISGYDVTKDRDNVRNSIGIVFQDPSLDGDLTGEENLRFHGMAYNIPKQVREERIKYLLEMVDLIDKKDELATEERSGSFPGSGRSGGGPGSHRRQGGQDVFLEVRDRLGSAVIGEKKVGHLEVEDRFALSIRDKDLDELQGHGNLVLKRHLTDRCPDPAGCAGRREDEKQEPHQQWKKSFTKPGTPHADLRGTKITSAKALFIISNAGLGASFSLLFTCKERPVVPDRVPDV